MEEYSYIKHGCGMRVKRTTSYIYFIEDHQGNIKIGVANYPDRRLHELQCAHANQLTLRAIMRVPAESVYKIEKGLHDKFRPYWINREWFNANAELEQLIYDCLTELPVGDFAIKGKKRKLSSRKTEREAQA